MCQIVLYFQLHFHKSRKPVLHVQCTLFEMCADCNALPTHYIGFEDGLPGKQLPLQLRIYLKS
jgi:hypothetical protein